MRHPNHAMWGTWQSPGAWDHMKTGRLKPHAVVTVEKDWWLTKSNHTNPAYTPPPFRGGFPYSPIRWWKRRSNNQVETELPPVKSINWERSIDQDVASCTIELVNQKMDSLTGPRESSNTSKIGNPGYYSPGRGKGLSARSFNQSQNEWYGVLTPNALIRTREGYGGQHKTWQQAETDGNIVLTGVWLVDDVSFRADGTIVIQCRDIGALLLNQQLYPPLMRSEAYPMRWAKWRWVDRRVRVGSRTVTVGSSRVNVPVTYRSSSGDVWYPGGVVRGRGKPIHGHFPDEALKDGSGFWLSVGNSHPSRSFCTDFWECNVGNQSVDTIDLETWGGGLTCYVSVREGSTWRGANTVPYDHSPLIGNQPHVVDTGADIPYVIRAGTGGPSRAGHRQKVTIKLPRRYNNVTRIRVSFRNHVKSPWGPWFYRAGLYRFRALRDESRRELQDVFETRSVREQNPLTNYGGYSDYSDIIKTLVLLSGWWHLPPANPSTGIHSENRYPTVFGNIETTSAWADEPLPAEMFDKRPVMDAITEIKQIVGYIFRIGAEGEVRFETPNWWRPGNFDEAGNLINFIPAVSENTNLIEYEANITGKYARSEVIISTMEPEIGVRGTKTTRVYPANNVVLKGQVAPAEWINGSFLNTSEQRRMAELIALHAHFKSRVGQATVVGNPLIDVDTQISIQESTTAEYFVHYVRGVSSTLNLEEGSYTMSLSTNWLGGRDNWAIGFSRLDPLRFTYVIPDDHETWDRIVHRMNGRIFGFKFNKELWQQQNADRVSAAGGLVRGLELVVEIPGGITPGW